MTVSKASPLRWLILLSLMALSAFVAYDISLHGTFQKSQTGQALKDAGVLQAYDKFAFKTRIAYANASKWFSKNGPTFLKQAADSLVPYLVLMKNLLIVFSNAVVNGVVTFVKYVAVKLPLLHEAIESYCPGITEWSQKAVQNLWAQFLQLAQYLAAQSVIILGVVFQYLKQVFAQVTEYLQKNVLVGDYSPENLQKAAFQGLSLAQEYVSSSVTWLSHKLTGLASQ
uniref:Transmembrane protein n=1 Tax=Cacopsylla melanoneura TaxID=428564 RepID=A0A8D8UH17_9HEMI